MSVSRVTRLVAAAMLIGATAQSGAFAQDFPTKPIRIINSFAPGGATDVAVRGLTAHAADYVDQTILVEDVTGAGGVTGLLKAKQAAADGQTLLVVDTFMVTLPLFQQNVPVSAADFRPIGVFATRGSWLLTRPGKGWKTLQDFVDAARARPGEITVGVPALGSPQQLAVVAIEHTFDIKVNVIPYGGGAPTMAALLGDQIDAAMPGAPAGLDLIKAGEAVFLVASTDLKIDGFPGKMISFKDAGVPYDLSIWTALWAPKDTPDATMTKLADIFGGMAKSKEWLEFTKGYGVAPVWMPLDEASTYIKASGDSMAALAAMIK